MRTNIVVTKKGDTEDYFRQYAYYCEPDNLKSIEKAVIQAYSEPVNDELQKLILENFKWEDTAMQTYEGYLSIKPQRTQKS